MNQLKTKKTQFLNGQEHSLETSKHSVRKRTCCAAFYKKKKTSFAEKIKAVCDHKNAIPLGLTSKRHRLREISVKMLLTQKRQKMPA